MASVRHLEFVIVYHNTAFHVRNFVLSFHDVRSCIFWNTLYYEFKHFGFKLPVLGLNLTIFGEKGKKYEISYFDPR